MSGIQFSTLSPEVQAMITGMSLGEVHFAVTNTSTTRKHLLQDKRIHISRVHPTITEGFKALATTDLQSNTLFISPDSHSQAAALTLSANCSKVSGMGAPTLMNTRSRIGHSANFDALLTVSGYGNHIEKLYFMHGRGSATNLHCIEVTGDRNYFYRVHAGGPMHATEGDTAGYSSLELTGAEENFFEDCVFGTETIARSAANSVLRIGTGADRNIFRNCTFLMFSDAATPYFIEVLVGNTYGWTKFENCHFINYSSNWANTLTVGCNIACAVAQHKLIMDSRCSFVGVTDVVAAAKEGSVLVLQAPATTTATSFLLNATADAA